MHSEFNHIDKFHFPATYPSARAEACKLATIQNSFDTATNHRSDVFKAEYSAKNTSQVNKADSQTSNSSLKTPQNQRQLYKKYLPLKFYTIEAETAPQTGH